MAQAVISQPPHHHHHHTPTITISKPPSSRKLHPFCTYDDDVACIHETKHAFAIAKIHLYTYPHNKMRFPPFVTKQKKILNKLYMWCSPA